jgi:hypothetical protein
MRAIREVHCGQGVVGVSASAVLDLPAGSLTSGAGLARGMCHVSRRTGIPP